ncbi:hypothetical protein PR003_g27947 [Phytophthora rubi]|uniref:Uncharacterized protein n=2 Tax=Phytophthora rubi TaxID=129364 RepID=A0A6A4BXV0_9STRA|nr:hypothetical protein PR003_g27947 [Phytophthora rubi]
MASSGLLRPRELFQAPRFAMWLLGSPPLGGNHKVSDLLLEDRHMLRQLDAAFRPAGRLLLPLAVAPSADQLARLRLWVDDSADVDANGCWAKVLQQQLQYSPGGFVVVTVFKQPEGAGRTTPRQSSLPGSVGTRLLLSNPHVNVWDFSVPSGASCELHEHLHPYVFFNRTPCNTRALDEALQPSESATSFAACEFRYVEIVEGERHVHAFQNPGKVDVQQYVIEFVS